MIVRFLGEAGQEYDFVASLSAPPRVGEFVTIPMAYGKVVSVAYLLLEPEPHVQVIIA